jgi:hypothetical protein
MNNSLFHNFRLVGGTALSLQLGHRMSIDDMPYGTIPFDDIDDFLLHSFEKLDHFKEKNPGIGKSYTLGNNAGETLKLDIYYTHDYFDKPLTVDNIRMATTAEIAAMKMDVIQRGGRKKDFWDVHEMLRIHDLESMIGFHKTRYPYTHELDLLKKQLINFSMADKDFEPICLGGKYWEFIKEDIAEEAEKLSI